MALGMRAIVINKGTMPPLDHAVYLIQFLDRQKWNPYCP